MSETGAFEQLIRRTVHCLNEANIDYCIVGAIAASYYGSVRSTEDLDVITNLSFKNTEQIRNLTDCLRSSNIDLIEDDMLQGLLEKSHITAFDTRTYFYRVDFKGIYSSLDRETMTNKVKVTILDDLDVWLTTPELQIIAKLQPGMRSEKDITDIKNILLNYKENLDLKVLKQLSKDFKIAEILEQLLD
ncbi:MAG: hypothetical protein HZR80_04230 [Candidatus Heimdallarchaeota archaeon]